MTKNDFNGADITGNSQVYFANVKALDKLPLESEMEKINFFDSLPDNLTHQDVTDKIFPLAFKKKQENLI